MNRIRGLFSETKAPYTLFGLAVLAHLAVFYTIMFFYGPCVFFLSNDCKTVNNDTQHYVVIANNLSHGNGYSRFADPPYEPDGLRTPLLPLYFTPFTYFGGLQLIWLAILLLNLVLALAPVVLYKLSRFFLPHAYAVAAGLFLVFGPLYLYRSQIAEPDALMVLLLISALYFLVRSWKRERLLDLFICAVLLGLGILAKPTALYLALIMIIFEIIHLSFFSKADHTGRLKRIVVMFGIIVLIVFPWLAHNKLVFGTASLSSIQAYNMYEYYTKDIPIAGDTIPPVMYELSREPSRYPPFQYGFIGVSILRIREHPREFAKEMAVGAVRNLFVSDISAIYYYGHTKLLPFTYNPENHTGIHAFLLRGDLVGALKASVHTIPKLLWAGTLFAVYISAFVGWFVSWKRNRLAYFVFTLFFLIFGYLIAASGPYVEAKYRLPAFPLLVIVGLYGLSYLTEIARTLRAKIK